RLDPSREAAWKRLGYKRSDGRWMTAEQSAAGKADREAQAAADRLWTPRLLALRNGSERPADRADARARLDAGSGPAAVRARPRGFGPPDDGNRRPRSNRQSRRLPNPGGAGRLG